jgi:phosphopantothenoylcysteine decarboxylase / phosphopantothenate---cysteine ligase
LIAGPLSVEPPVGPKLTLVESTDEMARAVGDALPNADVLVMAAAPADFRAADPAILKIKKGDQPPAIELAFTTDVLRATRERRRPGAIVVGFALETNDVIANSRKKLASKDLDLIVANDATEPGAGFGVDTNKVTLLLRDGSEERLPLMSKDEVADAILDRVERLADGR